VWISQAPHTHPLAPRALFLFSLSLSLLGTRAIGAEGRSMQQVLQDAVNSIREIKHTRTHTSAATRTHPPPAPPTPTHTHQHTQNFLTPPLLDECPLKLAASPDVGSPFSTPPPLALPSLDDETVHAGLLTSQTMAVFELEIPGVFSRWCMYAIFLMLVYVCESPNR